MISKNLPTPKRQQESNFIPREEISAAHPWNFANIEAAALLLEEQRREREQQELHESLRQQGRDEGYKEGHAAGFAQGQAQAQAAGQKQLKDYIVKQGSEAARKFAELMASASAQLDQAEAMAAQDVLHIAVELARQVLRQEIATRPETLLPVVREALSQLFNDTRAAQIRLNPQDLAHLEDALRAEYSDMKLTLVPDESITRGGCLVESAGTVIDGRIEQRWARTIARLGQNRPWEDAVAAQAGSGMQADAQTDAPSVEAGDASEGGAGERA